MLLPTLKPLCLHVADTMPRIEHAQFCFLFQSARPCRSLASQSHAAFSAVGVGKVHLRGQLASKLLPVRERHFSWQFRAGSKRLELALQLEKCAPLLTLVELSTAMGYPLCHVMHAHINLYHGLLSHPKDDVIDTGPTTLDLEWRMFLLEPGFCFFFYFILFNTQKRGSSLFLGPPRWPCG